MSAAGHHVSPYERIVGLDVGYGTGSRRANGDKSAFWKAERDDAYKAWRRRLPAA